LPETIDTIDGTTGETVKTTTYPDLGTRVERYAKDGSIVRNIGSAAANLQYDYGIDTIDGVARLYYEPTDIRVPTLLQRFGPEISSEY